jgi:hypothetical protein
VVSDRVLCAAQQLRDALYVTLADADAKPCRVFLSPSVATPIDFACDCDGDGQAWVALVNQRSVGEAQNNFPCAVERETLFVLGVARCAYSLDDAGEPPTPDQLTENFERMTLDLQLMNDAVVLFAQEFGLFKNDYRFGDFEVHPVRGGAMAYTQEVWVRL